MFSLHETTQRRVCRIFFLVCGVLPTLVTLVWVAYSLRPWREADWQRALSQQLHVRAAVDQIASPRPGVTRLTNVRLADLRSEQPLGSLGTVRARWQGAELTLLADELRVEAEHFLALASTLTAWMSASEVPALELQAQRLNIVGSGQRSMVLTNLRMRCETPAAGAGRLAIRANVEGAGQSSTAQTLQLVVDRQGKATSATLETGTESLPSWLLADLLPSVARCGQATFSGSIRMAGDNSNVNGLLQGRFDNLVVSEWMGSDSPHRVDGVARVEFEQLAWRGKRVESARGTLRAVSGAISPSLLVDAVQGFYCVSGQPAGLPSNTVGQMQAFDELACGFQITSAGITLKGLCGPQGCLMTFDSRPLLLEPRHASLPVAQLVQMLSQPATSWLPATQEAHEMAGGLPLPTAGSKPAEETATRSGDSTRR